jgi:hypothetical protein
MPDLSASTIVLCFVLALISGLAALAAWHWFRAWQLSLQSWLAGIPAGVTTLALLHLRRVDTVLMVNTRISAHRAGIDLDLAALAAHHLAGGNVRMVASAMISAKRFGLPLTFERAAAIELLGKDPVQLVADAVYEANQIRPPPQGERLPGIAKDAPVPIVPHQAVNAAAVLLQAAPGTCGVVAAAPRLTAVARFAQGDLEVVIDATAVPRLGDRLTVTRVDGLTVFTAPAADEPAAPVLAIPRLA